MARPGASRNGMVRFYFSLILNRVGENLGLG